MAEIRELDVLDAWRRPPGTLDRWVRITIALACAATVVVPWVGAHVLWEQGGDAAGLARFWFCNGLALLAAFWVTTSFAPKWRLSRFVRLAVLLPVAHVVLVACAWPLWLYVAPKMAVVARWDRLVVELPLAAVIGAQVATIAGAASVIARRRRDASWSQAFVMIALVNVLLLGLWLPIASWSVCHGSAAREIDPDLAMLHPVRLVSLVVVPPLVIAIAYAALAIRKPEAARRWRPHTVGLLLGLLVTAFVMRADAPAAARVVYANFIHVLLGGMIVACAGIVGLGAAMVLRARHTRRHFERDAIEGVVTLDDSDEPIVGVIEIAGWLRGPRPLVRPFVLATSSGDVPVHGARLATPIDASTTALRVGESLPIIRSGDRIAMIGHRRADAAGPFRTQATLIAGDDVVIAPHALPRFGFADVALALWRPAIAYLVILVAVAMPALAALASNR